MTVITIIVIVCCVLTWVFTIISGIIVVYDLVSNFIGGRKSFNEFRFTDKTNHEKTGDDNKKKPYTPEGGNLYSFIDYDYDYHDSYY